MSVVWYYRRLRAMSAREVAWRGYGVADRATPARLRREPGDAKLIGRSASWDDLAENFRAGTGRPILLDRARLREMAELHPVAVAELIDAADHALEGRFQFFGYPAADYAGPVDWHLDPLSGTRWPAIASERIDHRTTAGDPKWIWELNRLQHLVWLAEAWLITGDDRYSRGAFEQIDSWLDANPPGMGIAWRGAFEAGIRGMSVAIALQGFRDSPELTTDRYRAIVRMLAHSARRCWRERSRFSSANNHLIGEMSGCATVALLFPELAQAAAWEKRAMRQLAIEAPKQILPDGGSAEQAIAYQVFTAELLTVPAALVRARGDQPPAEIVAAIDRSAQFLADLVGDADPTPRYGDDDGGFALRVGPERVRTVRRHLAAAAAFTGNSAANQTGESDLMAALLAHVGAEPGSSGPPPAASRYAADTGLVVLRSGGQRITMDVGPLGYLSIAAHGHADALALTMSVDGRDVITDPGTASYYAHPEWRSTHRGTSCHATVAVDGADQSVLGGAFLWSTHAHTTVDAVDLAAGIVDARHDGYERLPESVTHRRWLVARPGEIPLVVDLLTGAGTHDVAVSWPLHPAVDAAADGSGHLVTHEGMPLLKLTYAATVELDVDAVRGDAVTDLGWWSDRLEAREPAWLLGARCRGAVPVVVVTALEDVRSRTEPLADLAVTLGPDSISVTWSEGARRRGIEIDRHRSGAVVDTADALSATLPQPTRDVTTERSRTK